jgi:hypothetical protein
MGCPFFGLTQRGEYKDLGELENVQGAEDENVRVFTAPKPELKLKIDRLQAWRADEAAATRRICHPNPLIVIL